MRNAMKMKEEKKRWLHFYNRILSGVLVLLGFNACDGTGADEYGTPYCRFEIKGKVLDELREPVKDARVIVKELNIRISITCYRKGTYVGWRTDGSLLH